MLAAGRPAPPVEPWNAGGVLHILPTVSHDRALLKISLREPRTRCRAAARRHPGVRRTPGPGRHLLDLRCRGAATGLGLPPDPGGCRRQAARATPGASRPSRAGRPAAKLRVLFYTCAGGNDLLAAATAHGDPHPAAGPRAVLRAGCPRRQWRPCLLGPAQPRPRRLWRASPRHRRGRRIRPRRRGAGRRPQRGGPQARRGAADRPALRHPLPVDPRPSSCRTTTTISTTTRPTTGSSPSRPTPSCGRPRAPRSGCTTRNSCPTRRARAASAAPGGWRVAEFRHAALWPAAGGAAVRLPPLDGAAWPDRRLRPADDRGLAAAPDGGGRDRAPDQRPLDPARLVAPANGANGMPIWKPMAA